jgi:CheY-like chemotaxis protein
MVANEPLQRPVNRESELGGLRILLVEDDEGSRVATCRAIELLGARVTTAGDATAALTAYTQTRPDAVVLDIGLPGEDGYSLIQRIRNLETAEQLPRTPVIALTAFARAKDRRRSLDAGFDEHLPKPLDMNALTTAIVNLTSNSSGEP